MTVREFMSEIFRAAWDATPEHRRCYGFGGRQMIAVVRDRVECIVLLDDLLATELAAMVYVERLSPVCRQATQELGEWLLGAIEADELAPIVRNLVVGT